MSCITYGVYHVVGTDRQGRQILSHPQVRRVCDSNSETPPPPTNSFCASGYSIRHYYQNILDGTWYGIAICGRNNR